MDILLFESDQFLIDHGITRGGMELVGATRADELLAASGKAAKRVPGGSACNTTIGLGQLCGKAVFEGTRGDDELGRTLESAIASNHVVAHLQKVPLPQASTSVITWMRAIHADLWVRPRKFHRPCFRRIHFGEQTWFMGRYLLFNEN
jgi:sugar/nucleoside kinase (ribokinase family)